MDFKEFCKQFNRMCAFYPMCDKCGLQHKVETHNEFTCRNYCMSNPDEAEEIVKEFAEKNLIATNGMKFEEIFGETFCSNMLIGSANEWWNAEYKGDK